MGRWRASLGLRDPEKERNASTRALPVKTTSGSMDCEMNSVQAAGAASHNTVGLRAA